MQSQYDKINNNLEKYVPMNFYSNPSNYVIHELKLKLCNNYRKFMLL